MYEFPREPGMFIGTVQVQASEINCIDPFLSFLRVQRCTMFQKTLRT